MTPTVTAAIGLQEGAFRGLGVGRDPIQTTWSCLDDQDRRIGSASAIETSVPSRNGIIKLTI
jgi:hypothetical protein